MKTKTRRKIILAVLAILCVLTSMIYRIAMFGYIGLAIIFLLILSLINNYIASKKLIFCSACGKDIKQTEIEISLSGKQKCPFCKKIIRCK